MRKKKAVEIATILMSELTSGFSDECFGKINDLEKEIDALLDSHTGG